MVTAATNFPYPYYHTSEDTADKIGFDRQTRVVWGLENVFAKPMGGE
ncbi:MAG: hypothetical protein ACLQNE_25195 [Thermoguttaceae bacterium]|jgi:hypothetical protein